MRPKSKVLITGSFSKSLNVRFFLAGSWSTTQVKADVNPTECSESPVKKIPN